MWRTVPWIRLIVSGLLIIASCYYGSQALVDGGNAAAAFISVILLTIAGILLGCTFRRTFSLPFTGIIDRIYFGNDPSDNKPPLNLRLPCAYRAERCYQKAIDECERQLEWHSLSPELWAELLLASRSGRHQSGHADSAVRLRALECLGMTETAERFDKIVRDRDNLPPHPLHLASQFDR